MKIVGKLLALRFARLPRSSALSARRPLRIISSVTRFRWLRYDVPRSTDKRNTKQQPILDHAF